MDSFIWTDSFVTGLQLVDDQHQVLVDILNEFGDCLSHDRITEDEMRSILDRLLDYTRTHFRDEEELMQEMHMDQRHRDDHKAIHQSFVDEVVTMASMLSMADFDKIKRLYEFLIHWLAYHILGMDQNMARQIRAIKKGVTPCKAYEDENKANDGATAPLLAALNGLFREVSERNRELTRLNETLEQRVAERTEALAEANRRLEALSLTDALTSLPNRRHAMKQLAALWQESLDHETPLACIMIDADHFKEVNDSYGHDVGDTVLKALATALRHAFRTDDIVCRLGGDEFFVICPNTDLQGATHVAELTRRRVANLWVPTGGDPWLGSISVGVAARDASTTDIEALMKKADQAVYAAKQAGKNCVRAA